MKNSSPTMPIVKKQWGPRDAWEIGVRSLRSERSVSLAGAGSRGWRPGARRRQCLTWKFQLVHGSIALRLWARGGRHLQVWNWLHDIGLSFFQELLKLFAIIVVQILSFLFPLPLCFLKGNSKRRKVKNQTEQLIHGLEVSGGREEV